MLSSTASHSEQKKEKASASRKNVARSQYIQSR